MVTDNARYHGIAIGLHWLIAVLIIGLLAVGKYMTALEPTDPTRFALTQLHKSFGVVVLLLVATRCVWRLTHKPPALPAHMKRWEKTAAESTHVVLYALMILIPVSGWIMVSASPLNLPTLLFKTIPWPHLPPFASLPNKESVEHLAMLTHEIAASVMILLLLAHIGAALRHRIVLKDTILQRMSPRTDNGDWVGGFGQFVAVATLITAGLLAWTATSGSSPVTASGNSDVTFRFTLFGDESAGAFTQSEVEFVYDRNDPAATVLNAIVKTGNVSTGDAQIDSTLPTADWFDSGNHPDALFRSVSVKADDPQNLMIDGILTIRGTEKPVQLPISLIKTEDGTERVTGGFTINRLDFGIGAVDQPDDGTAGYNVVIEFGFDIKTQ